MFENVSNLKTINELNPSQNWIYDKTITKFLSDFDDTYMDRTRPKGPDYLIMDNFAEYFEQGEDVLLKASIEA